MTPEEIRLECLRLAVSLSRAGVDDAPAVLDLADLFCAYALDGAPRVTTRTPLGRELTHHWWVTLPKDPPPGADSGGGSGG